MDKLFHVITIGSATLDVFVKSRDFQLIQAPQTNNLVLCEVYGAKMDVDELRMLSGGGATNAAVSFLRKGLKTAVVAELGRDLAATAVVQDLHNREVDCRFLIQEPEENTAMSVILVSAEGGRSIITCRGASKMLDLKDIPWEYLHQTEWLYITSLGGHLDLWQKIIEFAHQKGVKVAINPGQAELSQADKLSDLFDRVNVLLLNMEELAALLQQPTDSQPKLLLKQAQQLPAEYKVITHGKHGSYLIDQQTVYFCPASDRPPVETTGAGDAFGSGLVAGLVLGWPLEKSLQLAWANAREVINHVGAKQGLISLEEFEQTPLPTVETITL